jgi:DNA-binding transcriptional LysR family regulator
MKPTPRALAMAHSVRLGLAEFGRALATSGQAGKARIVTIAANSYAQCILLPGIIHALQRTAPEVGLDIRAPDAHGRRGTGGDHAHVMADISGSNIDLTLDWLPQLNTDPRSAPPVIVLRDPHACIVRRWHPTAGRRLTMSFFAQQRHVTVAECREVASIERTLAAVPRLRDSGTTAPDIMAVPWIVAQTDMVGTVPRRLASRFARTLELRVFRPPVSLPDAVLGMAWHDRGEQDRVVKSVREHILEAGRQLTGGPHA